MSSVAFNCPNCRKRVSLEESLAGRASTCPHCQEWLKVPEQSEPERVEPEVPAATGGAPVLDVLAKQDVEPLLDLSDHGHGHPRGSAALGGWSCLLIALGLMVFLRPAFFVWLPLMVVAFILGVVTLAKGHVFSGQLLLIGTLVLPVLVAMRFLGVELSEIPNLDQWLRVTAEPAEVVVEESAEEAAVEASEGAVITASELLVESNRWTAQETAMEASITEVENDWDQAMPEQAPNWDDRADYWAEQYRVRFVAPKPGLYVRLTLNTGAAAEGTLRAVTPEAVTLQVPRGSMTYEKGRLAPESRRKFFAEDFARHYATRKVRIEQQQFESRRRLSRDDMSSRL